MMKIFLANCFILLALNASGATTRDSNLAVTCNAASLENQNHLTEVICAGERQYRMHYQQHSKKVVLLSGTMKTNLHVLPAGQDPAIVGADSLIGFLPEELQPYKNSNILVYMFAKRTNAGGGGGQCGAGAEVFLNFLDVGRPKPTIRSSLLIGSCKDSIELKDQDLAVGRFGEIAVARSSLVLRFLNYKDAEGNPTATISKDFSRLIFD